MSAVAAEPLLDIRDLHVAFDSPAGRVHAVNGVSLSVGPGEIVGLVGESGSGKSVTMLSLLRLLAAPPAVVSGGAAWFEGRDLLRLDAREARRVNGAGIGMVFQDARAALNPVLSIGAQLLEPLRLHRGLGGRPARAEAVRLLDLVQLPRPEALLGRYAHELSGGMCQRVVIAIAIAGAPRLLVADEPTTALDVTIQAEIVGLVDRLRRELGLSVVWITHDLALLARLADRVLVMYAGAIVEEAPLRALYRAPGHPYTRRLLASAPDLRQARDQPLVGIEGTPPMLFRPPVGCSFAPRCGQASEICVASAPPSVVVAPGHRVSCWLAADGAAAA